MTQTTRVDPLPPVAEQAPPGARNQPWRTWVRDAVVALMFGLVLVGAAGVYYTERYTIMTESMEPTLRVGESVWAVRRYEEPQRGQIVSFVSRDATDSNLVLIKRVIGLPGERIEAVDGKVLVDFGLLNETAWARDAPTTDDFGPIILGQDEYFVMGDNRGRSLDSRHFGPISAQDIDYVVRR